MKCGTDSVQHAIADRVRPAVDSVDESMKAMKRAVREARHGVEDLADGAALQVRRHPLQALAWAGAAGVIVGGAVGLALGLNRERR